MIMTMTMTAAFTRNHGQIEAIIRHNAESTGVKVAALQLFGIMFDRSLLLHCDMTVTTAQGDEASIKIDHEDILSLLEASLRAQGYTRFTRDHRLEGSPDPEIGNGAQKDIVCHIYCELQAQS
jgi:hypothetical protein